MHFTWKMKARVLARDSSVLNLLMGMRARKQQKAWETGGRFGPPHIIKQRMLLDHAQKFHIDTLVETGTYLGDMIFAMKDHFKKIYSIELSEELHERAKSAFRKYPHIHLVAGDSATAIESVLGGINERCLFWLDGHYSGGITALGDVRCPIRAEIEAILRHPIKDHVLLIDDAICFDGHHGYPTLFELHDIVVSRFPGYEMQVFDNVIQIRPTR
ncbi:hypothetical protein [Edaphobacter modestus]|uniref:FkbM family methyltransferase n=1 Tax=Edaphobacter modestus TaxID=388466 RepID=A0A4Q7YWC3_9BACT|nr:hypothetical protein [Edaphobacter modestus]RZU41349.1 hypothetical protein BDD14_2866 [Edaphobacter modestus]